MTGQFAMIPGWVLSSGVSGGAIHLYAQMSLAADRKTRRLFHHHRTLARLTSTSVPTVKRHMGELVKAGAVHVTRRCVDGEWLSNLYHLPMGQGGRLISDPTQVTSDPTSDQERADVGSSASHYPEGPTETAAAAAASSSPSTGEQIPLDITEPPMTTVAQACQTAAVASCKAEAARRNQRLTNPGRYAMGRAADFRERYGARLAAMEAEGATEIAMVDYIERMEHPLDEPALVVHQRPALPEFQQPEFEEPDAAPPISIDERRARIAETRAAIAAARTKPAQEA